MQITSESLFHFTNSLKNIENILKARFHLTYCNEKFDLGVNTFDEHFPMISFCDLPLGLIKSHIEKYGSFGIGMTKEWGIANKLNPVLYLEKNSTITRDIGSNFDSITNLFDRLAEVETELTEGDKKKTLKLANDLIKSAENYLNILRHVKNYSGVLIRGDKKFPDYRFYDEREWRYIPPYDHEKVKSSLNKGEYKKYRGTSKTKPLIDAIKLDFKASDIKYLIVKSDKDIPKLIRSIKGIDNLTKNPDEADILTTKILTVDQIKSDM